MSIEVKNLFKHFGNFTALNDVSVVFPEGGLVALLGPSGCGKTSLLRVIAGLETPDSGQVYLNGADVESKGIRERQVGFVFQHYALFKHMSVFENVAFGLRAKPRSQRASESEIKKRVMQLLELVQLDWLADRYPAQLSGGQRQRVALARALAIEPQYLLLDEPFGALDAKVRKELRRWLRKLHDELHITSLFVTHDQEEALEVADKVVLMNEGRIEQIGTPEEVYDKPASEFVYRFLGSSNRFNASALKGLIDAGGKPIVSSIFDQENMQTVYARPHEITLLTHCLEDNSLSAQIERSLSIGPLTRLELRIPQLDELIEVELPRHEYQLKGLKKRDQVWIQLPLLTSFPQPRN